MTLNSPVTSRLLPGGLEAVLLVDDPAPGNQTPCLAPSDPAILCQVLGDNGQTFNEPGKFNVFQGIPDASAPNTVNFLGVPVDPAASGVRTYRLTNLRVDGTAVPGGALGLSPLTAMVSANPSTSMQINATTPDYAGFASNGLMTNTTSTGLTFLQCQTYPTTNVGTVTFSENFAQAFRIRTDGTQNTPGVVYSSESGFEIILGGIQAGYADTGTRFQTTISNIPPGVTIYIDNWAQSTAAICTPQSCPVPSDATLATSGTTPADPGVNTVTAVTDGSESSVTVTWEVTNTNPSAIDSITFNIYASSNGAAGSGTSTALSGLNPQFGAYALTGSIPQFSSAVNIPSAVNLFSLGACEAISGQVTLNGKALSGVTISLTGSENNSATTNGSGGYGFTIPPAGSVFRSSISKRVHIHSAEPFDLQPGWQSNGELRSDTDHH